MAVIKTIRKHQLGADAVRDKVEQIAQKLQKDLDASYHWEGSTLKFNRSGASGHIAVSDDQVEVEVKLGMLLSALKGTIEKTLNEELDQRLQS